MEAPNKTNQFYTGGVDGFGIEHINEDDIDNLFKAIKDKYSLKIDWDGSKCISIIIDLVWDYIKREVTLSMKGYIEQALKACSNLR